MVRVLVEKIFDPPITQEKWNQDVELGIPCHTAHNVRWIRSMMSRDCARVICEFEAPDAETVRKSFRKADLPFARIWTVDILEPHIIDAIGTVRTKGWCPARSEDNAAPAIVPVMVEKQEHHSLARI